MLFANRALGAALHHSCRAIVRSRIPHAADTEGKMIELNETAPLVRSVMLDPPTLDGAEVELFVAAPDDEGPHPAILFVHGYQDPPRPGGRRNVESGRVARAVARGS